MGEVRRYFCCTDNITGCKILGGIQLVYCIIALILAIVLFSAVSVSNADKENLDEDEAALVTIAWVIALVVLVFTGLGLLVPIILIVGAVKRNSCLLMTYVILNGLAIPFHVYGIFTGTVAAIFEHLIGLGIGIWVTLVAAGGYQEVKNSVNSV